MSEYPKIQPYLEWETDDEIQRSALTQRGEGWAAETIVLTAIPTQGGEPVSILFDPDLRKWLKEAL